MKYKLLAGKGEGMLKLVNKTVPQALARLGYDQDQVAAIVAYIDKEDMIEGAPELKPEHLAVFDCAFKPYKGTRSVRPSGHVKMMAACQPFVSGAISKTVNMAESSTIGEIAATYVEGWKLGLKALAIYRENSKRSQPLATSKGGNTTTASRLTETAGDGLPDDFEPKVIEKIVERVEYRPVRKRLPDERPALVHKFSVAGHEGYLHVGMYPDTKLPGEIFITMAKEGSTISGLMDAFATSVSIALQYGVPLADLCEKFSYMRFEPSGFTNNRRIPMAMSIMDYIFRYLRLKFLGEEEKPAKSEAEQFEEIVKRSGPAEDRTQLTLPFDDHVVDVGAVVENYQAELAPAGIATSPNPAYQQQEDAPPCSTCGAITVRSGSCYMCTLCGNSSGCG